MRCPDVGHACGHNIIASAAVGAGLALRPLAESLGFRLTVLGTPAEEAYGGKVDLINAQAFAGASAAMMIHPSPRDVVDAPFLAITQMDVTYHGKEAHASAYPHRGINALDAFVQAYVNLSTLRQHILSTDKIHGIITEGGQAPNIVPALTRSKWYVRSLEFERLEELKGRVMSCFEAAAVATGCQVEIETLGHGYNRVGQQSSADGIVCRQLRSPWAGLWGAAPTSPPPKPAPPTWAMSPLRYRPFTPMLSLNLRSGREPPTRLHPADHHPGRAPGHIRRRRGNGMDSD